MHNLSTTFYKYGGPNRQSIHCSAIGHRCCYEAQRSREWIPYPPTPLLTQVLAAKSLLERMSRVPDTIGLGPDIQGLITKICSLCSDVKGMVDEHARLFLNEWAPLHLHFEKYALLLQAYVTGLFVSIVERSRSVTIEPSLPTC